jgi:hypothetical protein
MVLSLALPMYPRTMACVSLMSTNSPRSIGQSINNQQSTDCAPPHNPQNEDSQARSQGMPKGPAMAEFVESATNDAMLNECFRYYLSKRARALAKVGGKEFT